MRGRRAVASVESDIEISAGAPTSATRYVSLPTAQCATNRRAIVVWPTDDPGRRIAMRRLRGLDAADDGAPSWGSDDGRQLQKRNVPKRQFEWRAQENPAEAVAYMGARATAIWVAARDLFRSRNSTGTRTTPSRSGLQNESIHQRSRPAGFQHQPPAGCAGQQGMCARHRQCQPSVGQSEHDPSFRTVDRGDKPVPPLNQRRACPPASSEASGRTAMGRVWSACRFTNFAAAPSLSAEASSRNVADHLGHHLRHRRDGLILIGRVGAHRQRLPERVDGRHLDRSPIARRRERSGGTRRW